MQLGDTFPPEEMYGDNYGYRSGLNKSMVSHLERITRSLETRSELVASSQALAQRLGFERMRFLNLSVAESARSDALPDQIDVVTALHACDTATDDAIAFGLQKKAKYMVLVPCCQAELARALNKKKALNLQRTPLAAASIATVRARPSLPSKPARASASSSSAYSFVMRSRSAAIAFGVGLQVVEALLGVQAWSAWLLFAEAAKACGSDLTRRCVYEHAKQIHDWTGGGLHAATDPGANRRRGCYLLIEANAKVGPGDRFIVNELSRETRKAMQSPELQQRLEFDGIETKPMSPQELTAFVEAETARWAPLAKSLAAANAEQ